MEVSVGGQRRSVIEGILTCVAENSHMSGVGGRNESIRVINDNVKQSTRRGEVVAAAL